MHQWLTRTIGLNPNTTFSNVLCVYASQNAILGFPGRSWPLLESLGSSWGLLASLGFSCGLFGSPGTSWALLGSPGLSWALLVSPGISWAFLDPRGLSWTLLGSRGCSWALLGSPGLSWALLGLSGLSWGPGSSWALLALPGSSWGLLAREFGAKSLCIHHCFSGPVVYTQKAKKCRFSYTPLGRQGVVYKKTQDFPYTPPQKTHSGVYRTCFVTGGSAQGAVYTKSQGFCSTPVAWPTCPCSKEIACVVKKSLV